MNYLAGRRTMVMTKFIKGSFGWYKPKAIYAYSIIGNYWYFAGWIK